MKKIPYTNERISCTIQSKFFYFYVQMPQFRGGHEINLRTLLFNVN